MARPLSREVPRYIMDKAKKKVHSLLYKSLKQLGKEVLEKVKDRVFHRGIGVTKKLTKAGYKRLGAEKFGSYSPSWAKRRLRAGKPIDKITLYFTGELKRNFVCGSPVAELSMDPNTFRDIARMEKLRVERQASGSRSKVRYVNLDYNLYYVDLLVKGHNNELKVRGFEKQHGFNPLLLTPSEKAYFTRKAKDAHEQIVREIFQSPDFVRSLFQKRKSYHSEKV